jgi:fucose permease
MQYYGVYMPRRLPTSVIFIGFIMIGMLLLMWGILLPDIAADLRMNDIVGGALFTLFFLGMMVGAMVAGKYIDGFEFLPLFATLSVINAVLLIIVANMNQWQAMLVMVFFVGIVSACMITIGHTLIARLYADKRFLMMGIMDFMFSVGTLGASFYVSFLYSFDVNWRLPLYVLSLLILCLGAYSFLAARQVKGLAPTTSKVDTVRKRLKFKDVLTQPVFILLACASFGYGAVEFGTANWFVSFAQQGRGFDGDASRMMLAFFTLGMVISRLSFALVLKWCSAHRLMIVLASMTFVGCMLATAVADSRAISMGNLLLGLGLGGLFPLMLSAAMNIDSGKGPLLSAICVMGNALGVQVASFATGFWANYSGILTAYWVIPMSGVLLWVFAGFYSRKIKQSVKLAASLS